MKEKKRKDYAEVLSRRIFSMDYVSTCFSKYYKYFTYMSDIKVISN